MSWVEVFAVLLVCHLAGDFILQTEWQAVNKHGGLVGGGPENRRALLSHVVTYAIPFVPAFVWIAGDTGAGATIGGALVVLGTHFVQDDGALLKAYVLRVKKTKPPFGSPLWMAIDQSVHVVWLFSAALLIGS